MEFELPKINVSFEYDKEKDEIVFVINGVEKRVKTKDMITEMEKLQEQNTALEQQPCEDFISREFIEIVVNYPPADLCTYPEYRGKPYFSIKYRENGKYIVGYGSYKIEMISQWIKEYFMPSIQPKTDVLDKIRAEIETLRFGQPLRKYVVDECLSVIDKYKAESEE